VREETFFLHRAANADGRSIERGAARFRVMCAGCHGIAAGGIDGVAPPLSGRASFATRLAEAGYTGTLESYVLGVVSAGRTVGTGGYSAVMPAFADRAGGPLREDQAHDVVAFVLNGEATAQGRSTLPWPTAAGGVAGAADGALMPVAVGKTVYQARDCLGCHGWPGDGGVTGPDLAGVASAGPARMPGLTAEQYIRLAILGPSATIAPTCPTGPCPDMMPRTYGEDLTQHELETLVRYLLTLASPVQEVGASAGAAAVGAGAPIRAPGPTVPEPDATAEAVRLARGAERYGQHCQGCHGDRGQGRYGTDLAAVRWSGQPVPYARASIADGLPGTTMPGWAIRVGGPLADADIEALAAHVVDLVNRR
jgi:mono/diheme cytochrome c family protein